MMMVAATSRFKFVYVALTFGLLCVDMSFATVCKHLNGKEGPLKVVMLGIYGDSTLLITGEGKLYEEAGTHFQGPKEKFRNHPVLVATKWPVLIEKAGQPSNWKGASVFKHFDGNVYLAVHIDEGHYVLQSLDEEKPAHVIKYVDDEMDGTLVSSDRRAQVIRYESGVTCLYELKAVRPGWFHQKLLGHEERYERDNKRCSKASNLPSVAFEMKNKIYALNPSEMEVQVFETTGDKFELTSHKMSLKSFFSCGLLTRRNMMIAGGVALVVVVLLLIGLWLCCCKSKPADDKESNKQLDSPMSNLTPTSSMQGASRGEPSMRPSSKALQSNNQATISAGFQPSPVSSQQSGYGQSANWPSNAPSMATSTFSQGPSNISATSSFNSSMVSNVSQATNTSNMMGSSMANSSAVALPSGASKFTSNASTHNSSAAQSNVSSAPSNASNMSKAASAVGKGRSMAASNASSVPGSRTPASSATGGSTASNALKPSGSSAISSKAGSSAMATSVTRPK